MTQWTIATLLHPLYKPIKESFLTNGSTEKTKLEDSKKWKNSKISPIKWTPQYINLTQPKKEALPTEVVLGEQRNQWTAKETQ